MVTPFFMAVALRKRLPRSNLHAPNTRGRGFLCIKMQLLFSRISPKNLLRSRVVPGRVTGTEQLAAPAFP